MTSMKRVLSLIVLITSTIGIFSPISLASSEPGLVAYYPFSGNANDQSGNGNDLAVFGAILVQDRFGNFNMAYRFDGSNDYMSASFDTSSDNTFSWTFWLRDLSTTDSIRRWLSTNNTNAANDTVIIRENFAGRGGALELLVGRNDAHGVLEKGQWDYYAVVSDSVSMKVYVNGVLEAINPTLTVDPEPGLFVGGFFDNSPTRPEYFEGFIDDIRLFDDGLTQAEIEQNFLNESLPPIFDADADGIEDEFDLCPNSILGETVTIGGIDSSVENQLQASGCTIEDELYLQCSGDFLDEDGFEDCVEQVAGQLFELGVITEDEEESLEDAVEEFVDTLEDEDDSDEDEDDDSDEDDDD
ncbi:MAG: hypothetical protein GKR91_09305 [Pseudomonadales bacterium]|nr:hypothetical protein [Pseudomonadales bacterium]